MTDDNGKSKVVPTETEAPTGMEEEKTNDTAPAASETIPTKHLVVAKQKKAFQKKSKATLQSEVEQSREMLKKRGIKKMVIKPTSHYMKYFDIAFTCALTFTALFTPVEVAFLTGSTGFGVYFWLNRVVDTIFLADMVQVCDMLAECRYSPTDLCCANVRVSNRHFSYLIPTTMTGIELCAITPKSR